MSYDSNRNQLSETVNGTSKTFTYNKFNQLTGFSNGNNSASYTYNPSGARRTKTVNGVTTNFVWNGSNLAYEKANGKENYYYYDITGITSIKADGVVKNYLKNSHGDVTAIADSSGTIIKDYVYDAFGNEVTENTADTNPFRYAGEYFDAETGQIYLRNRYYDPVTGRFLTEDTYWNIENMIYGDCENNNIPDIDAIIQSGNLYVYCLNNPINLVDSYGLFASNDNLYMGGNNDIEDVKRLQNELKWLGLYTGEKDGIYGPQTKEAVVEYQKRSGLKVDGIVGKDTWLSLGLKLEAIIFYDQVYTIKWENKYTITARVVYQTDEYGNLIYVQNNVEEFDIEVHSPGLNYRITSISAYKQSDTGLGIKVRVQESLGIGIPGKLDISLPLELRTIDIDYVIGKGEYFK